MTMKTFNEAMSEVMADKSSTDVALALAAAGFGIVPGTGAWRDGRPMTRKRGERGSHSDPLYGSDVMGAWLADTEVARECPYYLALRDFGSDEQRSLTVVDVDNAHDGGDPIALDDAWAALSEFMTRLGCPEATDTVVISTPHDGMHLYYAAPEAGLFKWITGIRPDGMPDGLALDWLTPTGRQNITGPGTRRDGRRYDIFVPRGREDDDIDDIVRDMPDALLRYLVEQHVARHAGRADRCFTSSTSRGDGANTGYRRALRYERIADLLRPKRTQQPQRRQGAAQTASLYESEPEAHQGQRHTELVRFAGACVARIAEATYDATRERICDEIRAYATHRCAPALDPHGHEVQAVIDSAMAWAEEQREEIETRIQRRVVVSDGAGGEATQTRPDFGERRVNGATYRCRLGKGGHVGLPLASPTNAVEALRNDTGLAGCFGVNMMTMRDSVLRATPWDEPGMTYPRPATEADRARAIAYIDEVAGFDPSRSFKAAFTSVAAEHAYDPLSDFITELRGTWDGREHIAGLVRDWLAPQDDDVNGRSFSATAMTIWMRGAIRRATRPGCKFDYCLLLTGGQGIGKSTFFTKLATRPDWICESLTDIADARTSFEEISQSWIVVIDELAAMRSAKDVTRVKTFLTRTHDDYRRPYATDSERVPRHCAFGGTSNELTFLADRSGSRRFIVLPCAGVINPATGIPRLCEAPEFEAEVIQAWAQAIAMEDAAPDEPLLLPTWAIRAQAARNEEHALVDPVEEKLRQFFTDAKAACEPVCYEQAYAYAYACPREAYARERHLKSFQDLTRRIAAEAGWTYDRYRSSWGIPGGARTRARGFAYDWTDEDRAALAEAEARAAAAYALENLPWTDEE